MILALRWIVSLLLFGLSLLAVVPVQSIPLWMLSIGAKEFGQWFVLGTILPLLGLSLWRGPGLALGILSAITAGLFLSSSVRAYFLSRTLPARMEAAFGKIDAARLQGSAPFRFAKLWLGERDLTPVKPELYQYAEHDGAPLSLRFFRCPTRKSAPCIIVLHTGGWNSGSPDEFNALNAFLVHRGYAVAAIEYRLAPRWKWPAQRDDAFDALRYLKAQHESLGIDPTQFVLLGRSAGGQIAEVVAYTAHDPAIRACIAFYAPADLDFAYQFGREDDLLKSPQLLRNFLGGSPQQNPENYHDASSINFVAKDSPPTLLFHGTPDALVWSKQSERLDQRLTEVGARHLWLRLPWATHGFDFNLAGPGGQLSTYAISYFLAAELKQKLSADISAPKEAAAPF
jgi:acetyl esterase/lipase